MATLILGACFVLATPGTVSAANFDMGAYSIVPGIATPRDSQRHPEFRIR